MAPINLLVIDDDKKAVERAMRHLKRHDVDGVLGKCIVDDSIMGKKIEDYCPSTQPIKFDAVLIDYQLIGQQFTGILVSAWMTLQLGIPRIALTTATYNGPRNYFDEFIRKDEINDNPEQVIHKVISCIENFNYSKWLNTQYIELVSEYSELLLRAEEDSLIPHEIEQLKILETILDKYDRILDTRQDERVKEKMEYLKTQELFRAQELKHEEKMQALQSKLEQLLSDLGENK